MLDSQYFLCNGYVTGSYFGAEILCEGYMIGSPEILFDGYLTEPTSYPYFEQMAYLTGDSLVKQKIT